MRATVLPVVTSGGALGVPDDPAEVGWWTGSALPGATSGSVVIDGHVDSAAAGPGALFRLTDLHTGDLIQVTTTTGDRHAYAVTGRRVYPKAGGLPPDLFATTGPPRLVLISCGGPFDRATGNYLDNITGHGQSADGSVHRPAQPRDAEPADDQQDHADSDQLPALGASGRRRPQTTCPRRHRGRRAARLSFA